MCWEAVDGEEERMDVWIEYLCAEHRSLYVHYLFQPYNNCVRWSYFFLNLHKRKLNPWEVK